MTPKKELEQAQQALSKAKIHLMTKPDSVFFSSLVFSLKHSFDDTIPTACTDGTRVKYSPKFFLELNAEERVFLILHETLHCAYLHLIRTKALGLEPRKANIAGDHVINLQLLERGYKMPKGGLANRDYSGMSMEEIYKILPPNPPAPPMEDLQGDPEMSEEDMGKLEGQIQDALVRASIQSKMAGDKPGTIPGEIEIFLNKLLDPKLPWQRILQKHLQNFTRNDYSWKRPNRRFFPKHHLPSLYSISLMNLAIAVDSSGSVQDHEFLQFVSEAHTLLRMMKPEKITLVQFDTVIHSVDEIHSVQELMRVKFTGRGGTEINPVLEWANENKPQALLVFTDGGFHFRGLETKVHTTWLIHNNPTWQAPFGKTIHWEI